MIDDWVKLYGRLTSDKAIVAVNVATNFRGGWLFIEGLCYCSTQSRDGHVTVTALSRFGMGDDVLDLAEQLVKHNLWTRLEDGFAITRWSVLQPQLDALEQRKHADRERQRRHREAKKGTAKVVEPETLSRDSHVSVTPLSRTQSKRRREREVPDSLRSSAAASRDNPEPTVNQRSKKITDAFHEAVAGMCNWSAANAVIGRAIKSGKFPDEDILGAVLRLAADNRPVTLDTLRIELLGIAPRASAPAPRRSTTDDRVAQAMSLRATFQARHDAEQARLAVIDQPTREAIER